MIGVSNRRRRLRGLVSVALGRCALAGLTLGLAWTAAPAQDQHYPSRPIRIIVGAQAGGSVDIETRIIGKELGNVLGQDTVIEDRPGAGGVVGAEAVANAAPDGYTLFVYVGDLFTVSSLMPQMSFDPNKQLLPLAQLSDNPLVVVAGGHAPFGDVKGLVAAAKASANSLTYATFAVASVNNVAGQWIAKEAGIKLLNVPYRSGPDAALATAAGNVALAIVSPASVYPALVEAGSVKVIGLTGIVRPSYLPSSWPTFAENGIPVDATIFIGLFGPVGLPAAIVSTLDHAVSTVLHDEAVAKRLVGVGIYPKYLGAAAFPERIRTDKARYDRIIRDMGMTNPH